MLRCLVLAGLLTVLGLLLVGNSWAQEQPDLATRLGRLPAELVKRQKTDADMIDMMFLAALARLPTDKEKENTLRHLKAQNNRALVCRDIMWALTNTQEFAKVQKLDGNRDEMMRFQQRLNKEMDKK